MYHSRKRKLVEFLWFAGDYIAVRIGFWLIEKYSYRKEPVQEKEVFLVWLLVVMLHIFYISYRSYQLKEQSKMRTHQLLEETKRKLLRS